MKKFLALALALVMVFAFTACKAETPNTPEDDKTPVTDNKDNENKDNETPATEAEYKLGMGISVSMASSAENNAQVDATVATVVLDAEGKIVSCRIDVAQNKMDVTDGAVDTAKEFKTKMELGDAYGMAGKIDNNGDGVMKEWYDQTKAFEAYVVGKTGAEVEAMQTQELNGHNVTVDEALLSAGCSMDIVEFKNAVVAACKDEQGMSFKTADAFTLGVAANTTAEESVAATAEENGTVKMYSDFAATVIGADGKIIATLNDAIQPNITIDAAGAIVETAFTATKRNLKEGYNMATYGANMDNNGDGKVLEWYVQSEAFSKYVVGKTGAEVGAMETKTLENGYKISAEDALLTAGCTIQITGITAVVAEAAANAR